MMRARRIGGVSAQAGKAARAAATASLTVCRLASSTCRATCPVAGLNTSWWRAPGWVTDLPLIQWETTLDMVGMGGCLDIALDSSRCEERRLIYTFFA